MEIQIGEYTYKSEGTEPQLGQFKIQNDLGNYKPGIRKLVDNFSLGNMHRIRKEKGYYIAQPGVISNLIPLTWTNDPRILEELR